MRTRYSLLPHLPKRYVGALSFLIVVLFFLWQSQRTVDRPFDFDGGISGPELPSTGPALRSYWSSEDDKEIAFGGPSCASPLEHLRRRKLNLTEEVTYQKRCIKTIWSDKINRDEIPDVRDTLVSTKPQLIKLSSCAEAKEVACKPLTLHVPPRYSPEPYKQYIFGIASKYDRLIKALPTFRHWLSGSNAKLVVVVMDSSKHDMGALRDLYKAHGIFAIFKPLRNSGHTVEQTHFTMIREIVEELLPSTKWIGLLDDDTLVTSLKTLTEGLGVFNPSKALYVGSLSEDENSQRMYHWMAFGGGGIFLSVPMAKELVPLIDKCINTASINSGDGILRDCINWYTKSRLLIVPGLHQHDFNGDVSGFYEGDPRPLLTVHHWNGWYAEPMIEMATAVHWCGDCFLQRWRFHDDTVLTNGYSISLYRDGLKKIDLGKMEQTWNHGKHNYEFSLGPLRPKLTREEKKQYKIANAGLTPSGQFLQTYVYRGNRSQGEIDEVIDLVWEPGVG